MELKIDRVLVLCIISLTCFNVLHSSYETKIKMSLQSQTLTAVIPILCDYNHNLALYIQKNNAMRVFCWLCLQRALKVFHLFLESHYRIRGFLNNI